MTKLYGSIEAGGTKFVCAVGDEELKVVEKMQFPTTTPQETIKKTVDFFKRFEKKLEAVAIGSFGPLILIKNQRHTVISQRPQSCIGLMLIYSA